MNYLLQILKKILKKFQKKQRWKITIEDLQGGTFTISNGGVYGSMLSTPILNLTSIRSS
jgi:2-oxoglutarate dehydrogenase E2 component (dihydrolipoamide succinyltransferase)